MPPASRGCRRRRRPGHRGRWPQSHTHGQAGVDEGAHLPVSSVFGQTVTDRLSEGRGVGYFTERFCGLSGSTSITVTVMPLESAFGLGKLFSTMIVVISHSSTFGTLHISTGVSYIA